MTVSAAAPTRGAHPLAPALPAASSPAAGAAGAAAPFKGKISAVPFVIGAVLALALADTRAAPVVIAVLTGAVIFQIMQL